MPMPFTKKTAVQAALCAYTAVLGAAVGAGLTVRHLSEKYNAEAADSFARGREMAEVPFAICRDALDRSEAQLQKCTDLLDESERVDKRLLQDSERYHTLLMALRYLPSVSGTFNIVHNGGATMITDGKNTCAAVSTGKVACTDGKKVRYYDPNATTL